MAWRVSLIITVPLVSPAVLTGCFQGRTAILRTDDVYCACHAQRSATYVVLCTQCSPIRAEPAGLLPAQQGHLQGSYILGGLFSLCVDTETHNCRLRVRRLMDRSLLRYWRPQLWGYCIWLGEV